MAEAAAIWRKRMIGVLMSGAGQYHEMWFCRHSFNVKEIAGIRSALSGETCAGQEAAV